MKENLTELVFILDKSGSMSGLEKDTIGGFNSMIADQKKEEGEVIISTVLFDTYVKVLHDRKDIRKVSKLTDKDYRPGGCTALLDALGNAISHIESVQMDMPEDERPAKTMFVITTDGQENSSREYTYANIKKMVRKMQQKKDWEFLFLGANMDAIGAAADIGIRADRAVRYECDSAGTALNYSVLSKTVGKFRAAKAECVGAALENWQEDIEQDFETRKAR